MEKYNTSDGVKIAWDSAQKEVSHLHGTKYNIDLLKNCYILDIQQASSSCILFQTSITHFKLLFCFSSNVAV